MRIAIVTLVSLLAFVACEKKKSEEQGQEQTGVEAPALEQAGTKEAPATEPAAEDNAEPAAEQPSEPANAPADEAEDEELDEEEE